MTRVHSIDEVTPAQEADAQVPALLQEIAILLELSTGFETAWTIANEVCDRYDVCRAA
jgi:hypothetical protein